RRDQAALAYKKTVLSAFKEVEDALAGIARLDEQQQALLAQQAALTDTVAHASRRYREGYSPYLEQIDAERALLAVQLNLIQARADHLQAEVALHQALGGGWARAS
ncbi:MAG TPA: TolC family protein, partial [Burkholderiaceae bacterium]|nr:TolC family protein [Burkholderiaceae bacterium]